MGTNGEDLSQTPATPAAPPAGPPATPPEEDLKKLLAQRGGMSWSPLAMGLVALLILGAGFLGGVIVGRHHTTTAAVGRGRFPGFGGVGGQGFPGGGAGGVTGRGDVTVGTVESVSGNTLTVRTTGGNLVTVTTTGTTPVQVTKSGAISDLTTGSNVVVIGATGSDGTVTATAINEGGTFGGGGFGGGGFGNGTSNAPPPTLSP